METEAVVLVDVHVRVLRIVEHIIAQYLARGMQQMLLARHVAYVSKVGVSWVVQHGCLEAVARCGNVFYRRLLWCPEIAMVFTRACKTRARTGFEALKQCFRVKYKHPFHAICPTFAQAAAHVPKLSAQTCAKAPHLASAHPRMPEKRARISCCIMHLKHVFCLFCLF